MHPLTAALDEIRHLTAERAEFMKLAVQHAARIKELEADQALARSVIQTSREAHEAQMAVMTYPPQFMGQVVLAQQHADKMRSIFRDELAAWDKHEKARFKQTLTTWADHVNRVAP